MDQNLSCCERLTDSRLFQAVNEICSVLISNGAHPYLVGGCVRDFLLKKKIFDFDIEVFGTSPENLINSLSPKFKLLPQKCFIRQCATFGVFKVEGFNIDLSIPRVEEKIGNKHNSFAITLLPSCSVEQAANRRDFTINAIYFDIKNSALCDPCGGVNDLKNKILRNVSPRFSEDPLRVLRGMQFISRLELRPTDDLIKYAQKLSPHELSPERIFGEWKKFILLGKHPSLGLRFLKDCEWIQYFPEILALDTCDQDKYRHPEGNVFNHTGLALDLFANDKTGSSEEDLIVGFATLCHDFGKPFSTTSNETGIHHYGHDVAGILPMKKFLERMRAPNWLIAGVEPLVRYHMSLRGEQFETTVEKKRQSNLLKLANQVGRLDRLLRVCAYDQHGRGGVWGDPSTQEYRLPIIEWAKKAAKKLNVFDRPPAPIIRGRDLIKLGISPSPVFTKILNQVFEAQLNLEFTNYDEGLDYLYACLQNNKFRI